MSMFEDTVLSGGSHVRRLSNDLIQPSDLYSNRNVVIHPRHLKAPSEAQETAVEIELAKEHLDYDSSSMEGSTSAESPPSSPPFPAASTTTDQFALAFDIDGVLIKGGESIPGAVEAMKYINGANPHGIKVPYIFVTNGGGKTEEERCLDLSKQLELDVSPGQFICGHTPMREMAEKYNTVLVVGGVGEKCRQVAEGYGFKDIVTPGDIIKTSADTTPFRKLTNEEYENSRILDLDKLRIEAIFVFADSRDWAGDQQIILDVLMSKNGNLRERSETLDKTPPVYFSHNDIVWATSHDHARIGMGALRASLEAMYKAVTGKELHTVAFGKPQLGTFQFATRLLRQWRKDTHGINKPPGTVYFVGDTPDSDIRGTNEFNEVSDSHWHSILVRTGVYQDRTNLRYPPKKICNDVFDAVKYAMEREIEKASRDAAQQAPLGDEVLLS
ncbi:HAD-like domain-containing protein [Aspergillus pseudoustus]|uniref:HAD-like domain-containing protein n=1 Tax=Aspergillus pseudoustus TaxID=1810923 RepID=A0ABR4KRL8_9EURO